MGVFIRMFPIYLMTNSNLYVLRSIPLKGKKKGYRFEFPISKFYLSLSLPEGNHLCPLHSGNFRHDDSNLYPYLFRFVSRRQTYNEVQSTASKNKQRKTNTKFQVSGKLIGRGFRDRLCESNAFNHLLTSSQSY